LRGYRLTWLAAGAGEMASVPSDHAFEAGHKVTPAAAIRPVALAKAVLGGTFAPVRVLSTA